jgi:DNA-binding transcriptional LysR family regulator
MRLLRELAHRGTLAAVARALDLSPSAVSQQLSLLAREVGEPLLEPAGRGVTLTPAAQILVTHTESILSEMETARARVAAARHDLTGTVRLATFQTAAHTFVPDAVSRLHAQHPDLTIALSHISADEALPALRAGDFDAVLTEQYPGRLPPQTPGAEAVVLLTDPLHLAVPSGWDARTLADLVDAPWALEHAGSDPRGWAEGVCRSAGFAPRVVCESADVHLHVRLVEQGFAAAFLPGLALPDDPSFQVLVLDPERATVRHTGAASSASSARTHRTIRLSRRAGSAADPALAALATYLHEAADSLTT